MDDLSQLDLFVAIGLSKASQDKKAETLNYYLLALGNYLNEKLSSHLDDKSEVTFKELLLKSSVSENEIISFYEESIPNIKDKITTYALEFKKKFIILVYEQKINELKFELNKVEKDLEQFLKSQKINNEIKQWQELLEFAKGDKWDKIQAYLTV